MNDFGDRNNVIRLPISNESKTFNTYSLEYNDPFKGGGIGAYVVNRKPVKH